MDLLHSSRSLSPLGSNYNHEKMENLYYSNRQFPFIQTIILKLGKEMQINHHSQKEHTKMSKIAKFGRKFCILLFCVRKLLPFSAQMWQQFPARNTKVYKICELCKAIISAFYNVLKLVYNGNCLLAIMLIHDNWCVLKSLQREKPKTPQPV